MRRIRGSNRPRVPAEWEEQDAVWMTWPSPVWWRGCESGATDAFAKLAATLSRFERLNINCRPGWESRIIRAVGKVPESDTKRINLYPHPTNDAWCRDSGCLFRFSPSGTLQALDFSYNAWGGKFPPWDLDDALAGKMAKAAGAEPVDARELTLEGGALEFDGAGTLMTTECAVLTESRNPGLSKKDAETLFEKYFGVENVVWLPEGLVNDDTDGHIDNIARFAPGGKVLAAVCGPGDPSNGILEKNLEILSSAKDAGGKSFEIVELPLPKKPLYAAYYDGVRRRLPASYTNYLLVNGGLVMPSYGDESDGEAAERLSRAFPDRKITAVDSRIFLMEGGAVHCLTQHQPRPLKTAN